MSNPKSNDVPNQNGGAELRADETNVGDDVTGRDKVGFDNVRSNIERFFVSNVPADDSAIDSRAEILSRQFNVVSIVSSKRLNDTQQAIELKEQALRIARGTGDRRREGSVLVSLGNAYADRGETRRAIEVYGQALRIARGTGDRRREGSVLVGLGNAYADRGEPRRAIEVYEQALRIARETGNRRREGSVLVGLGNAYADLGDPRHAINLLQEALSIARETGSRHIEGIILSNLGTVYADLGETRQVIELYKQVISIAHESGDLRDEVTALAKLAEAYRTQGEAHRAIIDSYHEALSIAHEIGDRRNQGQGLGKLGANYADFGDTRRAIDLYQVASAIAHEADDHQDVANFKLAFDHEDPGTPAPVMPEVLMELVSPYLVAISNIQRLIDEIKGRSPRQHAIRSIVSGSVSVGMDGVGETVNVLRDLLTRWRRDNAKQTAELTIQEKQAEIEKKKAEVLEVRAMAAKTREEVGSIAAEALLKREQAEQIRLQNESLRQELALKRVKLALDFVKGIAPDMSPEQQLATALRLMDDLKVLLDSPLHIVPALPSGDGQESSGEASGTP